MSALQLGQYDAAFKTFQKFLETLIFCSIPGELAELMMLCPVGCCMIKSLLVDISSPPLPSPPHPPSPCRIGLLNCYYT